MELEVLIPKECFCLKETECAVELICGYWLVICVYGTGKETCCQAGRGDQFWFPQGVRLVLSYIQQRQTQVFLGPARMIPWEHFGASLSSDSRK